MATKLHIGLVTLALAICLGQTVPASGPAPSVSGYSGPTTIQPGTLVVGAAHVDEADFGTMPDGSVVKLYTLSNAKGMQARVCSYGGTIAGIKAADKEGKFTNVEACADTWQAAQRYNMQAQTIGRVANRIAGAKFTLDGQEYKTQANLGANTLHSGDANFGTKNWQSQALPAKAHEAGVQLTMVSKDGDGGFPGTLTLKVTYTLTDDNEFRLDYEATTDKATPINVTNHAYWNLAGAQGWGNATGVAAGEQEAWIDADKYLLTDSNLVPNGQMAAVKGTALDFTVPTVVGARVAQLAPMRNYDHAFVLNSGGGKVAVVARLRDPKSGREMEVRTDQPGLQLYTGQRTGVALETQHHPDSVHQAGFPSVILKAEETFKTTTVYAFSAK